MNVRGLILAAAVVFSLPGCLTRPETDKAALGERRVVGYFPAAAIALEQYNPGLEYLTHINLWFFNYDRKGEISSPRVSALMLKRFIAEAHGEQTKVFVSIGGGHVTARTEAGRRYLTLFREKNFKPVIEALIRFADSTGIDGIDLDFEGDMMIPEYSDFIIELAAAVADKPYQLSGAFGYWGARKMRDAAVASFDFLNLMIYNESGLFDKELKDPILHLLMLKKQSLIGRINAVLTVQSWLSVFRSTDGREPLTRTGVQSMKVPSLIGKSAKIIRGSRWIRIF